MTEVNFTYSEKDNAWVSEEMTLAGDIVLEVSLKKKGIVILTTLDDGEWPKSYISPKNIKDLMLEIYGETEGQKIHVNTSEEPNYIRYADI